METQHTPGKWKIVREDWGDDFPIVYVTIKDDHRHICEVYNEWTPEDDANARLIAAAPDLLAACQDAVARLEEIANLLSGEVTATDIKNAFLMAFSGEQQDAITKATDQEKSDISTK